MAKWYAYGEDPLTYWALQNRLDVILSQLEDTSNFEAVTVFYRPSFGRGRRSASRRAEFGEFDAIVSTPEFIYPIEAKWSASVEAQDATITMRSVQIDRHKIFAWYLARYSDCGCPPWDRFVAMCDSDFRAAFPGRKLAPTGSKLALNTEFILRQLAPSAKTTTDVLLYLHPKGSPPATAIYPNSFVLVNVAFTPESPGGIFVL